MGSETDGDLVDLSTNRQCSKCGETKNIERFGWKFINRRRNSWCRDCQNKISNLHYHANKGSYSDRNAEHRRRNKNFINSLKKNTPCHDCNQIFIPCVMDFDHRDGSTKRISMARYGTYGLETLLEEIKKCDLVCANCHRIRTYNRGYGKRR